MKTVLREGELYFGDNGRVLCGRLDHAGMTPHFTGRDLSGQPVQRVTERDRREWFRELGREIECETCAVDRRPGATR